WNCGQFGSVNSGPALGTFNVSGTQRLGAILLGGGASSTLDRRLFMLRDDLAVSAVATPPGTCTSSNAAFASSQLTTVNFDQGAAAIGSYDYVYAGAL